MGLHAEPFGATYIRIAPDDKPKLHVLSRGHACSNCCSGVQGGWVDVGGLDPKLIRLGEVMTVLQPGHLQSFAESGRSRR